MSVPEVPADCHGALINVRMRGRERIQLEQKLDEGKFEDFSVKIEDDFELEKIVSCGQCFRAKTFENGTYRFITGDKVIYIRKLGGDDYSVCCSGGSWESVWRDYFDLGRSYRDIREGADRGGSFVKAAMAAGAGLRVLRQDAWEMLITFIISQRKSIPAISRAVEGLAEKFGRALVTPFETVHVFPAPEGLCRASEEELGSCGLGYRTGYVRDAAQKVLTGALNLGALEACGDEELFTELMKVHGVGKKVANCVALFGYGRVSRVPVDVWIDRAIQEDCHGCDPFESFGSEAGIIQQYVFYYKRNVQREMPA